MTVTSDRETTALGYTDNGTLVFCDPAAPGVRIIAAGDAYDRVLINGLRDEVFAVEDYDAEAAAREAVKDMPSLRDLAWQMKNAEEGDQP